MLKRDEYITFINEFKTVSPTITDEQRKGLLRRAVQLHGISINDAENILQSSGLVIGEKIDYFEVLGFSIENFQNRSELDITSNVDVAHRQLYNASLKSGGRPRPDGRTEEQWRTLLNQARDTLKNMEKRQSHIEMLQTGVLPSIEIPSEEEDTPIEIPSEEGNTTPESITLEIVEHDGMMLIPAGEFQMGSDDIEAYSDEKPVHNVYIDAYYIDKYPVTNAQYKLFLNASPQWQIPNLFNSLKMGKYRDNDYLKNWFRNNYPHGKDEHPVTWVSWYAAMAYAQWIGKRLPTEAEWEKASRGGLTGLKYPWGNTTDITKANFDISVGETTPVGQYPANKYGLYDVVGNVFEWCLDAWNSKFYNSSDSHNPISDESIESIIDKPTKSKGERVLRGGSWHSPANDVRIANRDYLVPRKTKSTIGFRCIKEIHSHTVDNQIQQ